MDILSKLPERLKEVMFDAGINAPKLAQAVGIRSNTITRYMQGVSAPSFESLVKLVEYFNCSADFLLGEAEFPCYEKKFLPLPPFHERFREVMFECKTTQYALQKKSGISWNNFHTWLNGKSLPNADSLLNIANDLECSVDFLLGRIR